MSKDAWGDEGEVDPEGYVAAERAEEMVAEAVAAAQERIAGLERDKAEELFHPWKAALEGTVDKMGQLLTGLQAEKMELEAALATAKAFHSNICTIAGWTHDPVDWLRDLSFV